MYYYKTGGVAFAPTSTDSGSGIAGYSTSSSGASPSSTVTLTTNGAIYAVDNAGNVSSGLPVTVTQDDTAPATPGISSSTSPYVSSGGVYYYETGGVTFTPASTDSGSGIAGYSTSSSGASPSSTVTLTTSGTIYAVDNVGNVSSGLSVTVTQDDTPPVLNNLGAPTGTGIYESGSTYYTKGTNLTFSPTATDSGSGVKGYNTDGSTTAAGYPLDLSVGATYTIYAVDNIGNIGPLGAVTVTQDNTIPTAPTFVSSTSPYVNAGTYYYKTGGVTFTLTATAGASGLKGYTTDPAGISPVPVMTPTLTASGTLYAVSNVGLVSATGLALTVTQDNTAPSAPTFVSSTSPYVNAGTYYYKTGGVT
ncbi:MAG: hypothetical protein ACLQMF_00780, partial [Rectinemataceae bacterium]